MFEHYFKDLEHYFKDPVFKHCNRKKAKSVGLTTCRLGEALAEPNKICTDVGFYSVHPTYEDLQVNEAY